MHPEAWRDLLLNLKLQLLALPSLLRWGVLAFAGILVLREGITAAWNLYQRRRPPALPAPGDGAATGPSPAGSSTGEAPALPAPDPFAPEFHRTPAIDAVKPSTPPGGSAR